MSGKICGKAVQHDAKEEGQSRVKKGSRKGPALCRFWENLPREVPWRGEVNGRNNPVKVT